MADCPEQTCLQSFLAGQLAEADEISLCAHVEECPVCQEAMDDLVRRDDYGSSSLLPPCADAANEPNFQTWIAKWKIDRRESAAGDQSGSAGDPERTQAANIGQAASFDFLGLPRQSGNLGRLGHYEIIELVGRGGMGVVFKAFDEKLHRIVAIKSLSPELAAGGTSRQRFIREAQAAAAVTHEHVIAIHAVEDDGPVPYLVMQYVEGISLEQRLKQAGALELKEILRIGLQTAEGLAAAHKQGLVHRDVKPANILLENGIQRVKITDFGLARAVDDASLTQSGMVAGTPMFMSPEQASGEPVDQRSDLFSLGSVLYMLCTGHAPFRASTSMAVLKRVCEETPRPICESNPDIPDWLDGIIARLHSKKPDRRYSSAGEVAQLLEEHLAQVQRPGYRARDMQKRIPVGRRRALIAAAAVILVVGVFVGYQLLTSSQGDDPIDKGGGPNLVVAAPLVFDEKHARADQEDWAQRLGVPIEINNSIGMKLRLIPPGELKVRDIDPRIGRVQARPIYAGINEVTVGQFHRFVKDTAYQTEAEKVLQGGVHFAEPHGPALQRVENTWSHADFAGAENWPVSMVTWHDARAFCDWLSSREGRPYRLPTESEWFWCAWGSSGDHYYYGNDVSAMDVHAWHLENSGHKVHPVGGRKANPWGLFDIYGNVNELCYDWHRDGKRETAAAFPEGPGPGASISVRGASFHDESKSATNPGQVPATWASSHVGFRVILADVTPQDGPLRAVAPFDAKKAREHQDAWAKYLGVRGESANSIDMKLALIPPGEFLMGSPDTESGRQGDEGPRRAVRITRPFLMGMQPVTVGQFKAFVKDADYRTEAEASGQGAKILQGTNWKMDPNANWQSPGFAQMDDHPVVCISWNDARAFCDWLSAKEKKKYSLPSEAQWEYACRCGAHTPYFFGDDEQQLPEYAWYEANAERRTHPIGAKKPNAWGLRDMHGHVSEWIGDWYTHSYYEKAPRENPTGPSAGGHRVLRGGDWSCRPQWLRAAFRGYEEPQVRRSNEGFRVVCEVAR